MGKTRVEWIDLVRAIAILTVLYIHATDGIYIISSDAILNQTVFSRVFDFASIFIGRIGVPFFLKKKFLGPQMALVFHPFFKKKNFWDRRQTIGGGIISFKILFF